MQFKRMFNLAYEGETIMYFYQDPKLFLQTLHPAALITYFSVVMFLTLACNHPVLLLAFYLILLIKVKLLAGFSEYKKYILFFTIMVLLIILINPLFNKLGNTVLWSGPAIPVVGCVTFTLEALLYGIDMGFRLIVIITTFFLYNRAMNPDRAFSFFARLAPGSVMLMTLTTRMIPYLVLQLKNIKEVQQTRGVKFDHRNLKEKIASYYPLIKVLLMSSLENAFNIAEAIQSRAYGSGRRSYYTREKIKLRDIIVLLASGAAALTGVVLMVKQWACFEFYPGLGALWGMPEQMIVMVFLIVFLSLPLLLNWGWVYWPYLKWRI